MPRLDPRRTPPSVGLNPGARRRAARPRCRGCGLALHELVAPTGYHVVCSPLPPEAYERLILTPAAYDQLAGARALQVQP